MVNKSDNIVLSKRRIGKTCVTAILSVVLFSLAFFVVGVGVFYAVCGLFVTPMLFAVGATKLIRRLWSRKGNTAKKMQRR